jgi:hypothetical protein
MDLRKVFATYLRRLWHAKELSQGDLAYEGEISCIYLAQFKKSTYFASLKIVGNLGIESAELLMATRKPQHSAPSARAVTRNMRLVSAASSGYRSAREGATVYTGGFGELLHRQRS